jgi:hypothetical protein
MGSFFATVVCLLLLLLLGTIIRFSFIGAARSKGSEKRLQRPELAEVESKWGIKLPQSLEAYYRSEIVTRSDFYLAPLGSDQTKWWYIEGFLPLTCRDLSDWIKVTSVPGIPIALNGSKGTYYIPFGSYRPNSQSPVLLRLPGRGRKDVEVAPSFDEFSEFEPKGVPPEGE